MESKDELKEIGIKNRTCYYFDDIMRVIDTDFSDILLDKKQYENILIYDISYKTFMCKTIAYLNQINRWIFLNL